MSWQSIKPAGLPVIHDRAAGIDIGARFHIVGVALELCGKACKRSRPLRVTSNRWPTDLYRSALRPWPWSLPAFTGYPCTRCCRVAALRTCSRSSKQKSQESEMDELQTGIEMSLAVFP